MPNGGSDCCGTCWFNRKNDGKAGYPKKSVDSKLPAYCSIRDVVIPEPFWTYCSNHPAHNIEEISTPVGPVFICDTYPYVRKIWIECPDTEEIRVQLVDILESIPEMPVPEYPSTYSFETLIIDHITALCEKRAIPGLRRILGFDPSVIDTKNFPTYTRKVLIGHAIEALARLAGNNALDDIANCLLYGLSEQQFCTEYEMKSDSFAAIRYHAVRGLSYCNSPRSEQLLYSALADPHPEIVSFAKGILDEKDR